MYIKKFEITFILPDTYKMYPFFKYILFIGITLSALPAFAELLLPQKRIPRNNSLYVDFSTELFYSHSNFDNDGYLKDLEDQNYITFFNYKLHFIYAPSKWVHIEPYIHAQTHIVQQDTSTNYQPFRPTTAGLKGSFFINTPFVVISPELDFSYPLDAQTDGVSRIVTNDRVLKLTPALLLHLSFLGSFIPFGKIAYQYRQDLSGLLIYHAGFMYQDNVWELGALFGGFSSVTQDQNPNLRHRILNQFSAGSLKFHSANPNTLGTTFWVDLKLSKKTQLFAHYGINFLGSNYAQGHSLNIGIRRGFVKPKSSHSYRRAVHGFEEKTEDMESLFNESDDSISPY